MPPLSNISSGTKKQEKIAEITTELVWKISNNSHTTRNLFRYCCLNCTFAFSLSPKTLNRNTLQTAPPSNSVTTIYSLRNLSSGLSSFFSSESYPLEAHQKQSLCHFYSGRPSKLDSLKQEFHNVCSSTGPLYCGSTYRCFAIKSFNETFISYPLMESGEVKSEASLCTDKQKLEKRDQQKFVLEIVDILKNNGKDLESRLSMIHSKLSINSITEIFEVLNSRRISGLRFFKWIWSNKPKLCKNASICSLIIDNFGRLDDYETMFVWLNIFTSKKICLTYEAFRFIPVLASSYSAWRESSSRVVDLLNQVGGSSRSSGVCALIEMFCKLDLFEMAKYIIKITESKSSYYCILLREMCSRGLVEDAHSIIREMGEAHWAPNTTMYNYLLGSLWKNGRMDKASVLLDEMNEIGIPRDAITFEILINFVCRFGKMDGVHQLLDQMVSQGLEPRLSTHACIVKTLFAAEKYEAAHKYVVDSNIVYKTSSNMLYSLMAKLHQKNGDIMSARNTLVEMMEKSLKSNFSIYVKIVKQLRRTCSADLARDLEHRHSKFL